METIVTSLGHLSERLRRGNVNQGKGIERHRFMAGGGTAEGKASVARDFVRDGVRCLPAKQFLAALIRLKIQYAERDEIKHPTNIGS